MICSLAERAGSVLVVLDLQSAVLRAIPDSDRVVARAVFLVRFARLLGVPIIQSEQIPDKLGATDSRIAAALPASVKVEKTTFSAAACPGFMTALSASGRRQVVITGIETHICVSQTACELARNGFDVFTCVDAVGARTPDRHEAGLERLREAGVACPHSEAIAYEWLRDSQDPLFREALRIVKESAI